MNWKILTVDDEKDMRRLLRASLERRGFEVTEASDGQEAVDKALSQQPDLILMDVMMPLMDGFTACQLIRNNKDTANIPIVHFSAADSDENQARSLKSGANLFVPKPTSPLQLATLVNGVLRDHYC